MRFIYAILIMLALVLPNTSNAECNARCMDDAKRAHDAYKNVVPVAQIGLLSAFALMGLNHATGLNKHVDDGWFFLLPFCAVSYEFGSGLYNSGKVGFSLSRGI